MRVRDVMTTSVSTVEPGASFKEIVTSLLAAEVSGLPVVDGDRRLLGIVTEADLVAHDAYGGRRRRALALLAGYFAGHDPRWLRKTAGLVAAELMTPHPVTASPDEPVAVAARRMLAQEVKRLPVVDGAGRLVGIVTRRDVVRAFARPDEAIAGEVTRLLANPLAVPEDHHVFAVVEEGMVYLDGTVRHPSDAAVVEHQVEHIDGVVAVISRLEAEEPDATLTNVHRYLES